MLAFIAGSVFVVITFSSSFTRASSGEWSLELTNLSGGRTARSDCHFCVPLHTPRHVEDA
eukprot:2281049-Amphidinium_carterae.1